MRLRIGLLVAATLFSVTCCATRIESRRYDGSGNGILYCLPMQLVKVTADASDPSQPIRITIEALEPIPDTNHAYVASVRGGSLSTDELTIKTSDTGLLEEVKLTSDGQGGQIVQKLAEAAVQMARITAVPGFRYSQTAEKSRDAKHVQVLVDPADDRSLEVANARLRSIGLSIRVVKPRGVPFPPLEATAENPIEGIAHRLPVQYLLVVREGDETLDAAALVMPNGGPSGVVPLDGGVFGKAEHTLSFDAGMLTSVQSDRPSEVYGAVAVLPEALKAIASIPGEIVKDAISGSNKEKELWEAKKAALEAQQAALEAQRAMEAARQPPCTSREK
jgi:hypothetical protein